jgi:hypothetical protein
MWGIIDSHVLKALAIKKLKKASGVFWPTGALSKFSRVLFRHAGMRTCLFGQQPERTGRRVRPGYLPTQAQNLNPVRYKWALLQEHRPRGFGLLTLDALKTGVTGQANGLRKRPDLLRSRIAHAWLSSRLPPRGQNQRRYQSAFLDERLIDSQLACRLDWSNAQDATLMELTPHSFS